MNPPVEQKAAADLKQAIRILNGSASLAFKVFMGWIASELALRDQVNRIVGQENKTSEAEALAVIQKHVAACLAPETDRDKSVSGAEGTSAVRLT